MKRIIAILLICLIALTSAAFAGTQEIAIDSQRVSLTTGLPTAQDQRIMVVQMDNEPKARPQLGIASADIVYEVEVYNGGYTRYSAVFNDTLPEQIEAIRSARIVNADIASEYNGWFIHYGGQNMAGTDVYSYIDEIGINAVDCLKDAAGAKYHYRDSNRSAPNNVVLKLKALCDSLDWSNVTATSPLKFDAENFTQQGEDVSAFSIHYRNGSYEPSYKFNADDGKYYRFYNGINFNDGITGKQVACDNVIIMHVNYDWFLGDSDRPVVGMIGGFPCDYFINGKHFTGTWDRVGTDVTTTYLDADGNEVVFKPGKTYIQVLNVKREWSVNG